MRLPENPLEGIRLTGQPPEADPLELPEYLMWRIGRRRDGVYMITVRDARTDLYAKAEAPTWRAAVAWVRAWGARR